MTQFGKRKDGAPQTSVSANADVDDEMSWSDKLVLSPKFPLYLTLGFVVCLGAMLTKSFFKHGLPSGTSLMSMVLPMAFLLVVLYFSFKGVQKQYRADRENQKQVAKYPQVHFWGAIGGAVAYGIYSPTSIGDLWVGLKDSFAVQTMAPGQGIKRNAFMELGGFIFGGLLVALAGTRVFDWFKERENAR
jgi:hypothetical protein